MILEIYLCGNPSVCLSQKVKRFFATTELAKTIRTRQIASRRVNSRQIASGRVASRRDESCHVRTCPNITQHNKNASRLHVSITRQKMSHSACYIGDDIINFHSQYGDEKELKVDLVKIRLALFRISQKLPYVDIAIHYTELINDCLYIKIDTVGSYFSLSNSGCMYATGRKAQVNILYQTILSMLVVLYP
jgi:hypothetical protein